MRVLIADDHEDAAVGLATLMEMADHEVRVALNGRTALEVCDGWTPDVVILDIAMPVLNGLEAAREFQRRMPRALLAALSGAPDWKLLPSLSEAGFHFYFEKGTPFGEIHDVLKSAFESRRLG